MFKTSEWVSIGHPDKIADYISCYILDRYLENDPMTRFALEVQIKDEFVTLGGEITSNHNFTSAEIEKFVKSAVNEIGYSQDYQNYWGKENTICGDDLIVTQHISKQSSDIAQGVNHGGWGDQSICHGYAVDNPNHDYMGKDYYYAKKIGQKLCDSKVGGLDIKTLVTFDNDYIRDVTVAVPIQSSRKHEKIRQVIRDATFPKFGFKPLINGTGKYVKHASVGDCGTTGRKLAVDFYGGNCKIGGGSPWGKDASKADVTLNIYARKKALDYLKAHNNLDEVFCSIACSIGKREILITFFDENNKMLESYVEKKHPDVIIEELGLRKPIFAKLCKDGLFSML